MSKKKVLEAILLALSVLLTAVQSSSKTKETKSNSDAETEQHLD